MAGLKEEVVISGIGGFFPESDNITELSDLLFNKKNGVTVDSRRWKPDQLSEINGTGKIKNIDKFDATFFSVHPKLSKVMDIMTKLFLERSIEAIIDAGLSPADLHGTNTGVFMGSAISETDIISMSYNSLPFIMLGSSRAMQANRLSFFLNLAGPSFSMDAGWICGSNGLKKAKEMIENGLLSSAIIGVVNLTLRPELQFLHEGINRLTKSDQTKSFSSDADGYNRSEACIVLYLQKASEAKRSYGTLLNVKSMQFGNHDGTLTEHSGKNFKSLLLDTYKEADIDPATVDFIEAYGSGIKSEDAMELNIMEEVFCTKNRKTPLKVGSVKSNVGHCEVSCLFMSIVKAIITLETGYIPPNINYTKPNSNVAALKNGKIQVITEKTPFVGDIIGISSFGLINSFSHIILKKNNIVNNNIHNSTNIPPLILVSGRNEENVRETLNKIKSHGNNAEFVSLTNDVFTRNINSHFFRGFNIFPNLDKSRIDYVWNVDMKKRQIWFIFSGMGSQWHGMGTDLMKLPVFADAINKCDVILKPRGIDIKNILTSQNPKLFDNILNSFVGIAAVQIGLVEVLRALDITPDGIIGHSVGELGCAYADNCFTIEEMILAAYARGRASLETDSIPGMMAAIGLGYDQIIDKLPHDIDVACRNSATSCTISGPVESINEFVSQLKSEGVFAKSVNVAGIAFHSRYIQSAGPTLLKYLKDVIKIPKKRSYKWVSSSLPETEWESDLAKYSSPEYHTNNLLSSVLFEDVLNHIPKDAITIEIAPHGLLQAIIKTALPETVTNISLTKRMFGDSIRFLLTSIGKMYTSGLNPKIKGLYPTIQYPVNRGTPSIHGLPFWDHTEKSPNEFLDFMNTKSSEKIFSLDFHDDIYLAKYQFHGQQIMPFSLILFNVWKTFIEIESTNLYEKPIQFLNLRFKNNVKIHPIDPSDFYIMIQLGSGLFECVVDDEIILSGEIRFLNHIVIASIKEKSMNLDNTINKFYGNVSENDIYSILKNNGFNLGFKNITNLNIYKHHIQGYVKWENDWIYFLEGLFKFPYLKHLGTGSIKIPVYIREMYINPALFKDRSESEISVIYNKLSNEVTCDGIRILGVKNGTISLPILNSTVVRLQEKSFIKFNDLKCKDISDFVHDSMDIIMETDKLNFEISGKIIFSAPYHYNDPIAMACTNEIKEIMENNLSINSKIINWDNIKDVSDFDESGRFITVANENYLQDTTRALANKRNSFIIVCSLKKLQELNDWKIITQQEFDNNNCLTLMKKIVTLEENSIFIKPTNDNYDLSIWRALETCNSSTGKIYIISKSGPLEGITTYVKEMLKKYKSKKLRFLFILDSNAPDFDNNKTFYSNQLSKDLLVNIYKNGDWGYYKITVLQDLKNNITVNEIQILKSFTKLNENKLIVKYIGLNFKDIVVEENTKDEFGPWEYSGHIANKTTMGIASINEMSSQIIYDPVLSWPIPSTWSLEEATTVPLAYAMSYYVFNILSTLQKNNSVLVTSGLHPIGQAAISISLDKKCETYAVVDSEQQAEQLSGIFPELLRSRIMINKNNTFDIQLKMITKSKGIDCILNFLSGESFYAAIRALATFGNFFNFSISDMKKQRYLGLGIFNFSTSFFAISSSKLLNENIENKQILQQAFLNGLNKGVIKPFRSYVKYTFLSINNIFDTMRINASSISYNKVLLSINDKTNNENCSKLKENFERIIYECNPDKVYLIIGNIRDWLDLAEWLVERGAQRIVIVVKRCLMSLSTCKRFDKLISRNVSIQIESDLHLKTKEESLNWLNYLTSSNELGALFIVNQFGDKKINNLRYSFEELKNKTTSTPFICILSKAEHVCAELKSIGFNALNISWDELSSEPKNTGTVLPSLDFLLKNSHTSDSYSFICSKKNKNSLKWSYHINDVIANFFPESANELHLLNNKIAKEPGFIEVSTRSPKLSQLKSVVPVFVIPGLKPKPMESFYKQFFYPAFEAQYPEDITSIDNLAETLVNKLKSITDKGYVSIIGETWGGIIALKMAQILESQGILVTVSLLEVDPEFLNGCAERFLSNDNFAKKLDQMYSSSFTELTKSTVQTSENEFQSTIVPYHQKKLEKNTKRALNLIWSLLRTSLESKPPSNRLHSKLLIFRYEREIEFNKTNLNDYCINPPYLFIIPKPDYRSMLEDKKTIDAITKNVTHLYPVGIELSLSNKYKNVYYNNVKMLNR